MAPMNFSNNKIGGAGAGPHNQRFDACGNGSGNFYAQNGEIED